MTETAFANPPHETARTFRAILDAFARPGRIIPFAPSLAPPKGLSPGAAAAALTLCDFQTPIWLGQEVRAPTVENYLRFHTGASITRDDGAAAFAFASAVHGIPDLSKFPTGTHEYPDRSATLIIEVKTLTPEPQIELTGPGIETVHYFEVTPLASPFWNQMVDMREAFPLGIDVLFVAQGAIAAITRSTRLRMMEAA